MAINSLIFDLGAVLIDWNPHPVILKSFDYNEEKTNWFFQNVCTHEFNLSLDKGKTFKTAKIEKTIKFPEYKKQIAVYLDDWEKMLIGEIPETVHILKSLYQSKKYKLFSITNWSYETFPIAKSRFPFLKWFDDIVVSGEVKMIKPDPAIYNYSLQRFAIAEPDTAIFIDDKLINVDVAKKLGLRGIHYKDPGQFSMELKKYGVTYL